MTNNRILFISKYSVAPIYGNPTRQFYISKNLVNKGYKVSLISSQSSGILKYKKQKSNYTFDNFDGVDLYLLKGKKIKLGFSISRIISWLLFEIRIFKLLKQKKELKEVDYIIVSSLSLLTFLSGVILKRRLSAKLIIEVRDIWPLTLITTGSFSKKNIFVKILSRIENIGYKNADAIIGTMPNLKEHIYNKLPKLKQKQKKIFYIPQGYDQSAYQKAELSETFLLNKSKIKEIGFNIIYAGTIGKMNKIDEIISCAKIIENQNINFYIMGDGPLKHYFQSIKPRNVYFLDPIPKIEVPKFIKMFNLSIFIVDNNPIYKYGISFNKSIDYMISGIPFVYLYNGYPSLYEEEKYCFKVTGNVTNLAAKIMEISKINNQKLLSMGKQGTEIAKKHHSFDNLSKLYVKVLQSI